MKLTGVTIAALLALTGCSGSFEPNMSAFESEIETDMADQLPGDGFEVNCPDSIEWSVGEEFHCIAKIGRQQGTVTVHMENEDGFYTWESG